MNGIKNFEKNLVLLRANQKVVLANYDARKENNVKPTKKDRVREHLLIGRVITGYDFIERFNITSYRDTIYALRKEGMNIGSWDSCENGIVHKVWYLADYDKDFIQYRNPAK